MSEQEHFSAVGTYLEFSVAGLVPRVFFSVILRRNEVHDSRWCQTVQPSEGRLCRKRAICH